MRLWATNMSALTQDVSSISFESTGAIEFSNEYSGLAVTPALLYCFR